MGHFHYSGKETGKITKLFKETQMEVALQTRNTIQDIVKPHSQIDKYETSGIYQIKCMGWPVKYVGQTVRTFHTRYKTHIQEIRNNNSNSGYSNHILNTGHSCGSITDTINILKTEKKGKHLNTLEKQEVLGRTNHLLSLIRHGPH
jgi:hypothetical protein